MNMVVDPEPIRSSKWWVNFLPQVNLIKKKAETEVKEESKIATAEDEKLKVAWRYNDLLEEKMLGAAESGKAKEVGKMFRYDNSKPMGNSVANESSHLLNKEGLMIHTPYDQENPESNLINLWENICEQI